MIIFKPYTDDYILYGQTLLSFFYGLWKFLNTMKSHNAFIKAVKIQFCLKKTNVLRITTYSNCMLSPDPKRTKVINDSPDSLNVKELWTLIRLFIYYKEFLSQRETLLVPLRKIIKYHLKSLKSIRIQ